MKSVRDTVRQLRDAKSVALGNAIDRGEEISGDIVDSKGYTPRALERDTIRL